MYTSSTKLSHRQTHSTHPGTLCCDQSHLKGFSLPIPGLPLGLLVYLFLNSFTRSVRFQPLQWELREFPSSLSCSQSFSQTASDPQPKGPHKGSVDYSWGVKQRSELGVSEASIPTCRDTHEHTVHMLRDIYVQTYTYNVCTVGRILCDGCLIFLPNNLLTLQVINRTPTWLSQTPPISLFISPCQKRTGVRKSTAGHPETVCDSWKGREDIKKSFIDCRVLFSAQ